MQEGMRIALALSGGALRAAAQIGAIRALEEAGVEIGAVSGSSAGAIVALLLASGRDSREMERFLLSLKRRDLFRLSRGAGLFSLKGLERRLRAELGTIDYGELATPFTVCVTELQSTRARYLKAGDPLANAVASCALSPIFSPRQIDGVWCIDGGFSDNLPTRPLCEGGLPILSINVNPREGDIPKSFRALLIRSAMIMLGNTVRPSLAWSDAHLEVRGVAEMGIFEFSAREKALEAGYREMKAAWPALSVKLGNTSVL